MPLGEPQRNLKKSRQHVHVLVPVEVRRGNSSIANFANLCVPLSFHFRERDPAARTPQKQALRAAREFAVSIQKTPNGFPISDGGTVAQIQMHSYPQAGSRACGFSAPGK